MKSGKLIDQSIFKTFKLEDEYGELFDINLIWDKLKEIITSFARQ